MLEVRDLHVSVDGRPVLRGIGLTIPDGEIHALMGPNGSGKTTLAYALLGHPRYRVERGGILLAGEDLTHLPTDERARRGLFLSFQHPVEVPGVTVFNFLRQTLAARGRELSVWDFRSALLAEMDHLEMDESFATRYLNEGFSGGEKKRCETLQMLLLKPLCAVLDEPDSGLDVDAVRVVAGGINRLRGPGFSALLITHYRRILEHVPPDRVHVLLDGRIVRSGGPELAAELEERGYDWLRSEAAAGAADPAAVAARHPAAGTAFAAGGEA